MPREPVISPRTRKSKEDIAEPPPLENWKTLAEETIRGEAMRLFCDLSASAVADQRSRCVKLVGKRCHAQIFNTLVGYEVSAARKIIFAPDMATARYLKIYSEIGLPQVHIPYNVSRTMELIHDLEKAYGSLSFIIRFFLDQMFQAKSKKSYLQAVFSHLRKELLSRMIGLAVAPSFQPTPNESKQD